MGWMTPHWAAYILEEKTGSDLEYMTEGVLVEEIDPETGDKTVGLNYPNRKRNGEVIRASAGDAVVIFRDGTQARWSRAELDAKLKELM